MGCSSCKQNVIANCCGCGCSSCKPFTIPQQCRKCPQPPPIEPCGFRIVDDVQIPVWNKEHPLIPRMRVDYPIISQSCNGEELGDCQLANFLKQAEPYANTCRYPGDLYYQAIILRAAMMIEYQESLLLFRASKASAIATGSKPLSFPKWEETFYGQLLNQFERQHPANLNDIFV